MASQPVLYTVSRSIQGQEPPEHYCKGRVAQFLKLVLLCFQITTVDEAKQFYPLFGLGANVALIFSGRAVKYFSNVRSLKLPAMPVQSRLSGLKVGAEPFHMSIPDWPILYLSS